MAEQMRPASPELAPDPTNNYERSHPENEAGQGRMDNNTQATPAPAADKMPASVNNAQDPTRQLNAQDAAPPQPAAGQTPVAHGLPPQPDHSMLDEEPMGWDQAPTDITKPEDQRHPRTGGRGGTPNVGEPDAAG